MTQQSQSPVGDARRKDILAVVLLVLLIAASAGGYYFYWQNNKTIHDMNEQIVTLQTNEAGLKGKVSQLENTIKTMEAAAATSGATPGAAAAAPTRRGKPLEYVYKEGSLTAAWKGFVTRRGGFEQPAWTPEQIEEHIKTDDLNGARGPELAEIECFEKLIGPEGSPYLRAIFESNAEEARFSKDIGMAGTFVPGIETLLAYYVTVGEPASITFLDGLLNGPIKQIAQTKFEGNYFTFATGPVVKALDECAGAVVAAPADEPAATPESTPPATP